MTDFDDGVSETDDQDCWKFVNLDDSMRYDELRCRRLLIIVIGKLCCDGQWRYPVKLKR